MASTVLETAGLVKDYGSFRALDGVDLSVEKGEIFGFLGPNGAGKTTTIRILLDLLRPTSGTVRLFGVDPAGDARLRSRVGYLPGELSLPPHKTAGEYLGYLAALRGGRGAGRIEPLARRFDLDLTRPTRTLSKGNKQKVGVVQAFMHDPELLILDEPTSGLDPLLQHEFLDLLHAHAEAGATVFMSSHVLKEVEEVAGRVAILRRGRVVDVDTVLTLRRRAGQEVLLRFDTDVPAADFRDLPEVENLTVVGDEVRCKLVGEPDALLRAAARHHVVRWHAKDRELEDLFLDFYREGDTDPGPRSDPGPGGGSVPASDGAASPPSRGRARRRAHPAEDDATGREPGDGSPRSGSEADDAR